MNIKNIWMLGVCLCLSACATTHWPWTGDSAKTKSDLPCPGKACEAPDAQRALVAASSYCIQIMDGYDNSRTMLGGSKVALSTVGALSGGVIAQVASGGASKAWAGVAGVTNGMQSKMDEAFSGALYVQRRRQVANAARTGLENVLAQGIDDHTKRVDAAIRMALGCSTAAAEADSVLLNAINTSTQSNQSTLDKAAEEKAAQDKAAQDKATKDKSVVDVKK